jgi:hypothetical protein
VTRRKRGIAIGAAALAALGGGTGLAVSATGAFGSDQKAFLGDVASRLGVTPDKLQAAITGAFNDRLDAAVKAGTLTQAQADAIKARQQAMGGLPLLGPFFKGPHGPGFGLRFGFGPLGLMKADALDAAATYLGLTTDQLTTQLGSGKTLADIVTAQGKTTDGLKAALTAAITKDLDAAVTAGKLTSSQESDILSSLPGRLDDLIAGNLRIGPRGGAFWFARGPGFGGGPFGVLKSDTLTAAASYLGLSLSDLRSDLGSGKSLADIVSTTQGKTTDGLKAAMTAAITKDLDAAVTAGKLTKSEEGDILSSLSGRLDDIVSGQPAFGRGWRRGVMPIP